MFSCILLTRRPAAQRKQISAKIYQGLFVVRASITCCEFPTVFIHDLLLRWLWWGQKCGHNLWKANTSLSTLPRTNAHPTDTATVSRSPMIVQRTLRACDIVFIWILSIHEADRRWMTTQWSESRYETPTSSILLNFTYEPVHTTARSLPSVATPALVCEKHWKCTGISFTETIFFSLQ